MKRTINTPAILVVLTHALGCAGAQTQVPDPLCPPAEATVESLQETVRDPSAREMQDHIANTLWAIVNPGECPLLSPREITEAVVRELTVWALAQDDERLASGYFLGISSLVSGLQRRGRSVDQFVPFGLLRQAVSDGGTISARRQALSAMFHMLDTRAVYDFLMSEVRRARAPSDRINVGEEVVILALGGPDGVPPAPTMDRAVAARLLSELRADPGAIQNDMARCRLEGRYRVGELAPGESRCLPPGPA